MDVRLSVIVQHHPDREALLAPLLERLGGPVVIATDPDPEAKHRSAVRSYVVGLETVQLVTPLSELAGARATHAVILQDDAWPCVHFPEAAARAIAVHPDRLLAFFAPAVPPEMGHAMRCAVERNEKFAELPCRRWVPVVALAWPVELVDDFLVWKIDQRWPPAFGADDEGVGRYVRERGLEILATVPSLVEHPDEVPSLVGRRPRGGRRAAVYDPELDPLSIRWS